MAKIESIDDVEYLVFEGGGGKGVLFLGAIEAFESSQLKSILPITPGGKSQIKGLAGSSIGALFAYLLTLGWSKKRIEKLWFDSGLPNAILDRNAFPGRLMNRRGVDFPNPLETPPKGDTSQERVENLEKLQNERLESISKYLLIDKLFPSATEGFINNLVSTKIAERILEDAIVPSLKGSKNPIISNLAKDGKDGVVKFIYGLVFDRGFYAGKNLYEFLRKMVGKDADLNFKELYEKTNIHLAVTGTNTSNHFPAYFSHRDTPKFRVLDAVTISMHYPILFKPVFIEASEDEPGDYTGLWIDGGYLNNLPIHAFDDDEDDVSEEGLNPNVLAIRIVENLDAAIRSEKNLDGGELTAKKLQLKSSDPGEYIARHLEDLLETLLYPSEPGQLRTPAEEEQTIQLFSEDLKTLVFETDPDKTKLPVFRARQAVEAYFETKFAEGGCKKPRRQLLPKQFEEVVRQEARKKYKYVSRGEITVHPFENAKTKKVDLSSWFRVDVVATNGGGKYVLFEAKSSEQAKLTGPQEKGHRRVEMYGGVITSSGNKEMDYGTVLRPQKVIVVRPSNYCAEIKTSKPV